jgi:phospholipid transport system transporter-binding protein
MIVRDDKAYRLVSPMLITNASGLLAAGRRLLDAGTEKEVIFDLKSVQEVDSSALAVLFAWQRSATMRGAVLHINNPPKSLLSLARLYGLVESLPIAEKT